jgi:hypothetical protein
VKVAWITEMIRPLWNTNWESTAEDLYDYLPCQRISFLRKLNYFMEKSEARAAYIPSLPSIPIPTSASRIIPTSFPPSPTAAILLPPENFLRSLTTSAF